MLKDKNKKIINTFLPVVVLGNVIMSKKYICDLEREKIEAII